MRSAAWSLVLLAVLSAGLQRSAAQSAAADDAAAAATTSATMPTDADNMIAVTDATTPEATTIPDVMTTVGVNSSAATVATDELMIITKLSEQAEQEDTVEARSLSLPVRGAVVVPLGHPARLPASPGPVPGAGALPALDGGAEEDFMEDMQEIEQGSDMLMAERSAAPAVPSPLGQEQEDILADPLPPNHKQTSDTNKQHRFVTAMPPDHDSEAKKYERMMATLPVRDYPGYNVTGRDKPLNVVFVFPRVSEGNQTRPRELEVMLVFPQDNTSTTAAPASTATEPTATTAAVPTVPAQVEDAASVDDGDDKLELASERKETRESAPSHLTPNVIVPDATKLTSTTASDFTPAATAVTVTTNTITSTPAPSAAASDSTPDASPVTVTTTTTTTTTSAAARATPHATPSSTPTTTPTPGTPAAPTPSPAFHRWKQEPGAYRQDIFKKYANKYASSRPPPVSFFRKDGSGSAAKRRTGGDDGDLETGASEMQHAVLPTVQAPWHTAAGRMRAPPPLYIPARLHAARPPQSFPSLPPNGMQPMLVAMPTRMAVLNGTRQAGPADTEAAPVSASSDAASLPERLPEGEALPQAQPEVRPEASQVTTAPAPRGRGRVRHGRPAGAGATTGPNTPVDIAASAMTEQGVHPVEIQRTHIRRRPLRNRQQAPDVLATTSTPEPASTPGTHGRPQDTTRVRPRPTVRPAAPQMYTILRPLMALRERLPGVRPTSTETPASTEATQALTGDEAATIKKITALQSGASGAELGPQGRMARLSSLQSMLVANLVAIQRELAERHADLRRHMDSLHLPAEHRAQGGGQAARTFTREAADTYASTTTGPMRRRYRRPPTLRVPKPPAPEEDKEQAARDNKVSYRTLYKKRTGVPTGKVRFGETLSTSTTTTATSSTTTNAAPSTTAAATAATSINTRTTPFFDHQTTTDEPSALTEAVVETTTTSEVQEDLPAPTTAPAEEAAGDQQASSTTSKSYPSAPPAAASSTTKTVMEAASASADVPADFTAEGSAPAAVAAAAALTADAASPLLVPVVPATLPGAARVLREDLLGFQASPPDPVHRPGGGLGRLTLLGGVLPEDDPAVAGGLFGLDRHGRGAFRAPLQMEGGFVPVIPGSALSLQQPAGAPQIVGPIPGGYRDVLRGSPVQLDLPRPDRPSDFLGRPVVAGTAPAQAALPARHVTRVMTRIPVRATAVAAPLRQG